MKGIARHRTVRHTPQQNGLTKRMNRTLIEKVRCMLFNANLSKYFWVEAVTTAAYLINKSPSSALDFKTTREVWFGKPPDLSNLRIFGCPTYAHISQAKLEPRAVKGYFIVYLKGVKGIMIWCINDKPSRTLISRDVVFYKELMLQSKIETVIENSESDLKEDTELNVEYTNSHKATQETIEHPEKRHKSLELDNYQLARDRERMVVKMSKKYGITDLISYALIVTEEVSGEEPVCYREAVC